jgi:long-subunit acyl-CoA synthetase (AMP-forming)
VRLKYVSECFLYGTSTENHNIAIIHPNLELLPKIAQELGVDETDVEKLCHNEKITAFILEELLKHGKN